MSDDSDIREYTRRGALGLMGAGGVFAVTETFGFTQLTADRGVGVSVGSDDEAGVKIVDDSDGSTPITSADFDGSALIRFENNTQVDIDNIICSLSDPSAEFTGDSSFDSSGDLNGGHNAPLSSGDSVVLEINNTTIGTEDHTTANPDLEVDILFDAITTTNASTSINLTRTITITA